MRRTPLKIYIANPSECFLALDVDDCQLRLQHAIESSYLTELAVSAQSADLIIINQIWKARNWHDRGHFASCPFLNNYSQKILTISHDDIATIFLPGLYVSLTEKNYWKNWSVPSSYKRQYRVLNPSMLEQSANDRRWLFSFRGSDSSHPLRRQLTKRYATDSTDYYYRIVNKPFHSHSDSDYAKYVAEILQSNFVLAPRGISPSSYRLFEAMQYGRCPVIISDAWQPILGIDWQKCSIRVAERDIHKLPTILKKRIHEAESLGNEARKIWEQNFSDGPREAKMLLDLIRLHRVCSISRDFYSLNEMWRSRAFREAHGWLLSQRVGRRLRMAIKRG